MNTCEFENNNLLTITFLSMFSVNDLLILTCTIEMTNNYHHLYMYFKYDTNFKMTNDIM